MRTRNNQWVASTSGCTTWIKRDAIKEDDTVFAVSHTTCTIWWGYSTNEGEESSRKITTKRATEGNKNRSTTIAPTTWRRSNCEVQPLQQSWVQTIDQLVVRMDVQPPRVPSVNDRGYTPSGNFYFYPCLAITRDVRCMPDRCGVYSRVIQSNTE